MITCLQGNFSFANIIAFYLLFHVYSMSFGTLHRVLFAGKKTINFVTVKVVTLLFVFGQTSTTAS